MANEKKFFIGFDLGGTKMLSAVIDENLSIVSRQKDKVSEEGTGDKVVKDMIASIRASLDKTGKDEGTFAGIGIGIPGPLDRKNGIVMYTPNLGFEKYPLREKLEKEFNVPVLIENDVNVGTYGEFKKGAAKGFRHVLGIFPGTGIGGGLIINGHLFLGATGNAGEIGHMIIQTDGRLCGCGQYGCVEALASKTSLAKDLVALAAAGGAPTVFKKAGTDFRKIRSSTIAKAVEAGEKQVVELLDRSAEFLGIAMANAVNLMSPEVIVMGGGLVERFGKKYIEAAEKSMRRHAMASVVDGVIVVEAALGDDSSIIGAGALIQEYLAEKDEKR